ncbi:MAG: amidohydrolase family protein [Chloroflexi bacterium]|nr:amidohydrolase family protein [Chloroflexota bacterium]
MLVRVLVQYMLADNLDFLITAPDLICPATGVSGPGIIGVRNGLISLVGSYPNQDIQRARSTLDIKEGVVLPGLVDLHAHPALSGSKFGINPDTCLMPNGSTTVLSQGDAGARNLDDYITQTIEAVRTRVKLAINFCAEGEANPAGRFFSLDEASVSECVTAIKRGGEHIWGISLNIALIRGKDVDPLEVMRRGMIAADRSERPVIFGATKSKHVPLAKQLNLLRSGDVMTYCFHAGDGSIVQDGRVLDCVWEARDRGVLFDVGDGVAAFGFEAAEVAIAEGFIPDTISTDYYRHHLVNEMEHDLPLVVSKLIAAGMSAEQCWPRVTSIPAQVLEIGDTIGRLERGAQADICVLKQDNRPESLSDGHGQVRMGRRWRPITTIKSGIIVNPTEDFQGQSGPD